MGAIKQLGHSFVKQIFRDGMLLILLPAPFLMGAVFRYFLPLVNTILQSQMAILIEPYYVFSDLMLIMITPLLSAMIGAFVFLDERDEGVAIYYQITPSAGWPYLISRIFFPVLWSFISTIIVTLLFGHVIHHLWFIISIAFISTWQGVMTSWIIVKLSKNKVEGLVVSKLMGFVTMGFLPSYLMASPVKYIFGFLPSFWIGEMVRFMYGIQF